ncbi:MAG: hypothetical protein KatS3mg087_0539 [Patescibacteria group bacterium]|nr:MAG: hypothetical protein KatS3mg087_0539 [Patescibacteria group bacterium]
MKINVSDITGTYAIAFEHGQKLHDLIYPELINNTKVELDFSGIKLFGLNFLNHAIGQLLRDFPEEFINKNLVISNINPNGKKLLESVLNNATQF